MPGIPTDKSAGPAGPESPWSPPAVDGHVDFLYGVLGRYPDHAFATLPDGPTTPGALRSGNVRILVSVFYCPGEENGPRRAAPFLRSLIRLAPARHAGLRPVRRASQWDDCAAARDGSAPGYVGLLENADALVEVPLEEIRAAGVLTVGLTHFGSNRLGDGNGVPAPRRGLTPAGRALLPRLQEAGFALDLAHLPEPGFEEALELFEGPVLSSHTGLRRFHDIPRNLSDDQVRALAARDGVVGLTFAPEMLSPDHRASVDTVARQLDALAGLLGSVRHLALGSDFWGFDETCHGLVSYAGLPALAERLTALGWPGPDVAGVFGGNWVRFYRGLLLSREQAAAGEAEDVPGNEDSR